ncbi:MAG: hypothetical protein HAW60_01130 [Bdellovibrionales bacterium]|nr:hypothetical protein [Bdellovibrionales bacterium]
MNKKLNKKEKEIADNFVSGKFKKKASSSNFKAMAQKTKESRINLRLQVNVLEYFQKLSLKEGIPYQTLINSVLFKVASGQMIEGKFSDFAKTIEELKKQISNMNRKKQA